MIMRAFLKMLVLPPASQLLGLLLAWLLWRRCPRLSKALFWLSLGSLWLLSTPLVSGALMDALQADYRPPNASAVASAQAVVVLGGGRERDLLEYEGDSINSRTLERVRYGARLQRASGLPMLVTGGVVYEDGRPSEAELMALALEQDFGVPVMWREGHSRTTAENALYSARVLREAGINTVLLVTHGWHMRRSEAVFRHQGLTVIPAPVGVSEPQPVSALDFVVSAGALRSSYYALHEWFGYIVYRLSGSA